MLSSAMGTRWTFQLIGALVAAAWLSTEIYKTAGVGGAILFFVGGIFMGATFGKGLHYAIFSVLRKIGNRNK